MKKKLTNKQVKAILNTPHAKAIAKACGDILAYKSPLYAWLKKNQKHKPSDPEPPDGYYGWEA